jgi:hypothetical protein
LQAPENNVQADIAEGVQKTNKTQAKPSVEKGLDDIGKGWFL